MFPKERAKITRLNGVDSQRALAQGTCAVLAQDIRVEVMANAAGLAATVAFLPLRGAAFSQVGRFPISF
jgi:hypothetical protein